MFNLLRFLTEKLQDIKIEEVKLENLNGKTIFNMVMPAGRPIPLNRIFLDKRDMNLDLRISMCLGPKMSVNRDKVEVDIRTFADENPMTDIWVIVPTKKFADYFIRVMGKSYFRKNPMIRLGLLRRPNGSD